MIYVQQQPQPGLGNFFKSVIKFVQTVDPVSHALKEANVGKTTIGKILVPTAINVDKPKVALVINAANCAKPENAKNPNCISFNSTQVQVQDSAAVVQQKTVAVNSKTYLIVGGAILATAAIIFLANRK